MTQELRGPSGRTIWWHVVCGPISCGVEVEAPTGIVVRTCPALRIFVRQHFSRIRRWAITQGWTYTATLCSTAADAIREHGKGEQ